MTEHISILDAQHSDVDDMVAVRCEAAEVDMLTRFQYGFRHVDAVQSESAMLSDRLGKRFTHPNQKCHIAKAVDTRTGELVGWALFKWEDGSWADNDPPPPPPGTKDTLSKFWAREVIRKWRGLISGKPHVMIGAMNVKVAWQNKGIGRMLVEHIYRVNDLDKELVIVQTTASAEPFYQKLGWVTVDSTDIDLSDWAGKGLGYGVLRSPQMFRYPKEA